MATEMTERIKIFGYIMCPSEAFLTRSMFSALCKHGQNWREALRPGVARGQIRDGDTDLSLGLNQPVISALRKERPADFWGENWLANNVMSRIGPYYDERERGGEREREGEREKGGGGGERERGGGEGWEDRKEGEREIKWGRMRVNILSDVKEMCH